MEDMFIGPGRLLYQGTVCTYVVEKDWCTCPGFTIRKHCKHVDKLGPLLNVEQIERGQGGIKSSLDSLNNLYGGYLYSSDIMVVLYAKYDVGKTILSLQEAFYAASVGHNVLIIDTEGGTKEKIAAWKDAFFRRYKKKGNIFFESKRTLESLSEYFGKKVKVMFEQADKKGDKGRMDFRVIQSVKEPEIDIAVKDNKIDFIILDSLSDPIRKAIPNAKQNNPAKDSASSQLLGKLLNIQERLGTSLLVTAHASFDPANQYAMVEDVQARGGSTFRHSAKRVLYMDKRQMQGLQDYRRVWMVRGENEPSLSAIQGVKYTDAGVIESDKGIDELLTDKEREKLNR